MKLINNKSKFFQINIAVKCFLTILILFTTLAQANELQKVNRADYLSQVYNETTLRTGNSDKHKVIAKFYRVGIPYKILYTPRDNKNNPRERWYRVEDFEGQTGWIRNDQLHNVATALVISNTQKSEPLYRRLDHAKNLLTPFALIPHHYVVHLLSCSQEWCFVKTNTAEYGTIDGFISRSNLWGDSNIY